jgi:hypothetical protein
LCWCSETYRNTNPPTGPSARRPGSGADLQRRCGTTTCGVVVARSPAVLRRAVRLCSATRASSRAPRGPLRGIRLRSATLSRAAGGALPAGRPIRSWLQGRGARGAVSRGRAVRAVAERRRKPVGGPRPGGIAAVGRARAQAGITSAAVQCPARARLLSSGRCWTASCLAGTVRHRCTPPRPDSSPR